MKQLVLKIPESEYRFFLKMVKSFSFVEIDEKKNKYLEMEEKLSPTKRKTWGSIKSALNEVELIDQGRLKGKTAREFIDEL